jgi:cytochrome c peroxidase
MKTTLAALLSALSLLGCGGQVVPDAESQPTALEEAATPTKLSVGKKIFFDTRLSEPAGQACATCHDPNQGFADPRGHFTSEGATAGRYGVRNSPSITYASYIPALTAAAGEAGYQGGLFWDGRSPSLEAQAGGPLLNPLEMNNSDKAAVVSKVKSGPYGSQFKSVFGAKVFDDVDSAFDHITEAIATFERQGISGRFSSKYDAYLAGRATLSRSESRGLAIFESPTKGNCAKCHLDKPAADGSPPLFTDWGYDNLGIPVNSSNPFYALPASLNPAGLSYLDRGLAGAIVNPRQVGKFKAPSLRNVDLTAPYGHNGYFPDLPSIVHFYNSRDAEKIGTPEVSFGMNTTDMGNLRLTAQDEADLVAFLRTLTDGA